MKSSALPAIDAVTEVTPLAGVWIEMSIPPTLRLGLSNVTPLAGVWIEIALEQSQRLRNMSLPLRECGLKLYVLN